MKMFAAFLRGVSPMNLKMPALAAALQAEGFTKVKTVLSSGNVVFAARATSQKVMQAKVEAAMQAQLGRSFPTIIHSVEALKAMLAAKPHAAFRPAANAKLVVTFLRDNPEPMPKLPIKHDGVRILAFQDGVVFSDYVVNSSGPVFMRLLEKSFGKSITTRTLDTVAKVVAAADQQRA